MRNENHRSCLNVSGCRPPASRPSGYLHLASGRKEFQLSVNAIFLRRSPQNCKASPLFPGNPRSAQIGHRPPNQRWSRTGFFGKARGLIRFIAIFSLLNQIVTGLISNSHSLRIFRAGHPSNSQSSTSQGDTLTGRNIRYHSLAAEHGPWE